MFAFSHKEFKGQKTSVLKSAVDAFNIFDLFVAVWQNMKWIWFVGILRRPYTGQPDDGRFDIWNAVHGKRDVAIYGGPETYAMLESPSDQGREDASGNIDEEVRGFPSSLLPGKKHRNAPDAQMMEELGPQDATLEPPPQYSSTYGKEKFET